LTDEPQTNALKKYDNKLNKCLFGLVSRKIFFLLFEVSQELFVNFITKIFHTWFALIQDNWCFVVGQLTFGLCVT